MGDVMTRGFKLVAVLAAVLVAGCIPRARQPERPIPGPPGVQGSATTLQCHLDLTRENIGFRVLPDRPMGGGCTQFGTVQLTSSGTPTTNLGPMTCQMALQFSRWTREVVQPTAIRMLGTNVARIETFGSYSCRPVNGQAGNRLSEHAYANAVDVSAFVLANGRRITVLDGWNSGDDDTRRFLRALHRGGCQRFAVGLGPEANRLHANHLHFDLGARGTCR